MKIKTSMAIWLTALNATLFFAAIGTCCLSDEKL